MLSPLSKTLLSKKNYLPSFLKKFIDKAIV